MEIYKVLPHLRELPSENTVYRKGEYQLRQHQADDIKTEQRNFDVARRHVMQTLKEEYDSAGISEAIEHQVLEQAELLGSGSFLRAVQSMISGEKVTAAYAVQTTRDELNGTFGNLKDPSIKERIHNVSRVSDLLLEILGKEEKKINLGEEPVILAADALSPAELMEMDKDKLLGIVTRKGSATSHTAILAKSMDIPCVTGVGIPTSEEEWEDTVAIIDGYTGTLYLEPDREVRREYEIRRKADLVEREALLKLKDEKGYHPGWQGSRNLCKYRKPG